MGEAPSTWAVLPRTGIGVIHLPEVVVTLGSEWVTVNSFPFLNVRLVFLGELKGSCCHLHVRFFYLILYSLELFTFEHLTGYKIKFYQHLLHGARLQCAIEIGGIELHQRLIVNYAVLVER